MFKILKSITLFILISAISISLHGSEVNLTKQEMWNMMDSEVSHWTDSLGHPIDKEIKDIVIALNLMGIETIASCGGHLDHGLPYPWVDVRIYSAEAQKMMQELLDIQNKISKEEEFLQRKFPDLSYNDFYDLPEGKNLKDLCEKKHILRESVFQSEAKYLEELNQLLDQFYEIHKFSYDNTLINLNGRLHSIGGDRQQIRSQEQKFLKLIEYRKEMEAFTIFLKNKFLD
jgi:hypothetical protein